MTSDRKNALLTDLYGLSMATSYLRRGMTELATFDLFVRRLPPQRGFLVAAGVEDSLDFLESLGFEGDDLAYLAGVGFDDAALDALGTLRFTGEVRAVPEGRIVFAGEPLVEVTAALPEAQIVETYLLNQVTLQTTLASKAARCRIAAAGRIELVDFGFRRSQGVEAAMAAARVSAMVGFAGTSNVEAARRFGLRPVGTMAHSYIEAFPSEAKAFDAYAGDFPTRPTFLVDTYDTPSGVKRATEVIRRHGLEDRAAIRLDSGDLIALARQARQLLDSVGLDAVRILVSGGLDEHDVERFVAEDAPIDAVGLGTRVVVSADAPYLDTVYKLVDYGGRPVLKLSAGKATQPGRKQVVRSAGLLDTVVLREWSEQSSGEPLLVSMMEGGRRVRQRDELAHARNLFEADLAALPEETRRLVDPRPPPVSSSAELRRLEEVARSAAAERTG